MELIIPTDRRRQDSVTEVAQQTLRHKCYWHVFKCNGKCNMFWMGKDLEKTHTGRYVCKNCACEVTDITGTQQAKDFLSIVVPGWNPRTHEA